jgi:hypothetical protein
MLPILSILFVLFIIALVVGIAIYSHQKEKERTLGMQRVAQQMGWGFEPQPQYDRMIPYAASFNLFNQGHSRRMKNVVYGQLNGAKSALFDYQYTVGHGKHRHTYTQSVLYFETPKLQLPQFTLSPEGFMHKLISALGYQDIDFGNRPEFSKKYLLRGPNEVEVRKVFQDHVLAFYEANQGLQTEGGGNQLFVYRLGYRVPPAEAGQYLQWGSGSILQLFQRPW